MNQSTALVAMPNRLPVLSGDGLDHYLREINAIPMLSAEEEQALFARYQQEGDLLAAQQIVLAHLRFVVRVAKSYAGYGLAIADLIQEGTIGLMKAVKRFSPSMNVRLVTFAVHWIKSEIHEFVIKNWRIVKVATTKAQRKLFFKLRGEKKRLGWFSREEINQVAQDLGVNPKDVMEMETRLHAHDDAFDHDAEDDETGFSPSHYLAAPEAEEEGDHSLLFEALSSLDERSQDIIKHRWLNDDKSSLKDLADKYGISIERVRQIEKQAMEKMRATLPQE